MLFQTPDSYTASHPYYNICFISCLVACSCSVSQVSGATHKQTKQTNKHTDKNQASTQASKQANRTTQQTNKHTKQPNNQSLQFIDPQHGFGSKTPSSPALAWPRHWTQSLKQLAGPSPWWGPAVAAGTSTLGPRQAGPRCEAGRQHWSFTELL